jgi:transcriptional regulator NrdR family protein
MVCVHCGSKTSVVNSRHQKRLNQVWRRRRCRGCSAVFSTEETATYSGAWTVQDASGGLQPFSRDKLLLSLHRSLQHRPDALSAAAALTDTVIKKLLTLVENGRLEAQQIKNTVQVALNRFDKAASTHYAAFHK